VRSVSIAYVPIPVAVSGRAAILTPVKVRRILLFVAAFLAFTASAPSAAAHGFDPGSGSAERCETPRSGTESERDVGPTLRAPPALRRTAMAAPGTGRRGGQIGARLFTIGAAHPRPVALDPGERVDSGGDARLMSASNASCCTRGPPAVA
jgi:hypothetical protein